MFLHSVIHTDQSPCHENQTGGQKRGYHNWRAAERFKTNTINACCSNNKVIRTISSMWYILGLCILNYTTVITWQMHIIAVYQFDRSLRRLKLEGLLLYLSLTPRDNSY